MKPTVFVIPSLGIGGAQHMITMLANEMSAKGVDTTILLTIQSAEDARNNSKQDNVLSDVVSIKDIDSQHPHKVSSRIGYLLSRVINKLKIKSGKAECIKYKLQKHADILAARRFFAGMPECNVIAFSDIPIVTMAIKPRKIRKKIRLIICERTDPNQHYQFPREMAFIRYLYEECDMMVFQTEESKEWYRQHIKVNEAVIPNIVKQDLPRPYNGERKKIIVDYGWFNIQKQQPLLVEAFSTVYKKYPEYKLVLYGNAKLESAQKYKQLTIDTAVRLDCLDGVEIYDETPNVHELVIDSAMFVSPSLYEGMSNSMLEAMAIGLPSICTDCPIGGAKAVIRDHENGILVPNGDAKALADAMIELIENPELAEKLSENGAKIREELRPEVIMPRWIELCK